MYFYFDTFRTEMQNAYITCANILHGTFDMMNKKNTLISKSGQNLLNVAQIWTPYIESKLVMGDKSYKSQITELIKECAKNFTQTQPFNEFMISIDYVLIKALVEYEHIIWKRVDTHNVGIFRFSHFCIGLH